MDLRITPPDEMIEAVVTLPISKSICNRSLIINALTPGTAPLGVIADCDDSRALAEAIDRRKSTSGEITLNVGAAGTAMRFATAWLSTLDGVTTVIDGSERLRRRPMSQLIEALRRLGAEIECLEQEGFAPMRITGHRLKGGAMTIDASVSSQFISALMMIGPTMEQPLRIELDGEIISTPYIRMTAGLMNRAGIDAYMEGNIVHVPVGGYRPAPETVERDWSAASYWYSIAAISAGFVTLPGLSIESLQGDSRVASFFERLGVCTAESEEVDDALEIAPSPEQFSRFDEDLSETPDIAQTIAVTAAMLGIPFHLRGLRTLRVKETDRLEALRRELDKFGIVVEIRNDSELVWNGQRHPIFALPEIDTYDDHRMAMAFAPTAVFVPGLVIRDAEVVSKSYPAFWDDMRSAGFTVVDASIPPENTDCPDTGDCFDCPDKEKEAAE